MAQAIKSPAPRVSSAGPVTSCLPSPASVLCGPLWHSPKGHEHPCPREVRQDVEVLPTGSNERGAHSDSLGTGPNWRALLERSPAAASSLRIRQARTDQVPRCRELPAYRTRRSPRSAAQDSRTTSPEVDRHPVLRRLSMSQGRHHKSLRYRRRRHRQPHHARGVIPLATFRQEYPEAAAGSVFLVTRLAPARRGLERGLQRCWRPAIRLCCRSRSTVR